VERIPRIKGSEAIAQPTRHPVTLYVFDSALIVTVRSRISGRVAIGTCR
jgi:hypothetical protein